MLFDPHHHSFLLPLFLNSVVHGTPHSSHGNGIDATGGALSSSTTTTTTTTTAMDRKRKKARSFIHHRHHHPNSSSTSVLNDGTTRPTTEDIDSSSDDDDGDSDEDDDGDEEKRDGSYSARSDRHAMNLSELKKGLMSISASVLPSFTSLPDANLYSTTAPTASTLPPPTASSERHASVVTMAVPARQDREEQLSTHSTTTAAIASASLLTAIDVQMMETAKEMIERIDDELKQVVAHIQSQVEEVQLEEEVNQVRSGILYLLLVLCSDKLTINE